MKITDVIGRVFNIKRKDYLKMNVDMELNRVRALSGDPYKHEKLIIADALKTKAMILAYGLNPGDIEELCRYFAVHGLPQNTNEKNDAIPKTFNRTGDIFTLAGQEPVDHGFIRYYFECPDKKEKIVLEAGDTQDLIGQVNKIGKVES